MTDGFYFLKTIHQSLIFTKKSYIPTILKIKMLPILNQCKKQILITFN